MNTITVDGAELVVLEEQPEWIIPPETRTRYPHCFGCFFDESDSLTLLSQEELGRPLSYCYSCSRRKYLGHSYCRYYIPKDYYERHKPK